MIGLTETILKAAGTPMMRPLLPASSLARLTLLPGDSSIRSTVGMGSPGLTMIAGVEENSLALVVAWLRLRFLICRTGLRKCVENMF